MKFGMIKSIVSQVLNYDDFTDNEDETGYIDFDTDLPAGAMPIGWRAVVTEGFAGDTTAVMEVGIDGDVDKYSANTAQSCLPAGTVGSMVLAADAWTAHATAKTPRVTVTGTANFTAINAGSMQVEIFYIEPKPFVS
jgi:hypothetical protein